MIILLLLFMGHISLHSMHLIEMSDAEDIQGIVKDFPHDHGLESFLNDIKYDSLSLHQRERIVKHVRNYSSVRRMQLKERYSKKNRRDLTVFTALTAAMNISLLTTNIINWHWNSCQERRIDLSNWDCWDQKVTQCWKSQEGSEQCKSWVKLGSCGGQNFSGPCNDIESSLLLYSIGGLIATGGCLFNQFNARRSPGYIQIFLDDLERYGSKTR